MTIGERIKNHPIIMLLGSATTIIAVVSALFTIDSRYAHAADVEKQQTKTAELVRETTNNLRRQMLEDKLFELDVKKAQSREQRLSPVDQALRDRYQRQVEELNQRKPGN